MLVLQGTVEQSLQRKAVDGSGLATELKSTENSKLV